MRKNIIETQYSFIKRNICPPPREACTTHVVTVSCRDSSGGSSSSADFARVVIAVDDHNDHDPVFLENMFVAKVSP